MAGRPNEPIQGEILDDEPGREITLRSGRILDPGVGADPDDAVSAEADEMYWEGVPDNTQLIYRYQWKRFIQWCSATNRPHMPSTVGTIREWINAHWTMTGADNRLCGRNGQPYAPDTLRLSLAVISVAHQKHGLLSPTHHPDAIRQMRGYARRWKRAGYRPDVAHALTAEETLAMIRTCDRTTAAGVRDAALLRLAADIGRRNSELMSLDFADLRWVAEDRMVVTITMSKTNKDTDEDPDEVAVEADVDLDPELCPLRLMSEWLTLCRSRGITSGPLFRLINAGQRRADGTHSGRIQDERMTRRAFQNVVTKAAQLSGVDRDPKTGEARQVVPHSLRAGFATEAEAAGAPVSDTADRGGWARESPVILRYFRSGRKWGDRNPAVLIRRANRRRRTERSQGEETTP
jgi:integrase